MHRNLWHIYTTNLGLSFWKRKQIKRWWVVCEIGFGLVSLDWTKVLTCMNSRGVSSCFLQSPPCPYGNEQENWLIAIFKSGLCKAAILIMDFAKLPFSMLTPCFSYNFFSQNLANKKTFLSVEKINVLYRNWNWFISPRSTARHPPDRHTSAWLRQHRQPPNVPALTWCLPNKWDALDIAPSTDTGDRWWRRYTPINQMIMEWLDIVLLMMGLSFLLVMTHQVSNWFHIIRGTKNRSFSLFTHQWRSSCWQCGNFPSMRSLI